MIRRALFCGVFMLGLPLAAQAAEIEFNVPVELRSIDGAASHVAVICGSFGDGRFLNSSRVDMPLAGEFSKSFSGVVKVIVAWPGAALPTGRYRCAMSMRTAAGFVGFDSRPAALNTRVVTLAEGSFSELLTPSLERKIKDTPRIPAVPAPR
jgi:hypothetical protein